MTGAEMCGVFIPEMVVVGKWQGQLGLKECLHFKSDHTVEQAGSFETSVPTQPTRGHILEIPNPITPSKLQTSQ